MSLALIGLVALAMGLLISRSCGRRQPARASVARAPAESSRARVATSPPHASPREPVAAPPIGAVNSEPAPVSDPAPVAAPPPPASQVDQAAGPATVRLAGIARDKQREMYRQQLASLPGQRERLVATIARLEREGVDQAQLAQIQRRLQQMVEAEARMRRHLESMPPAPSSAPKDGQTSSTD